MLPGSEIKFCKFIGLDIDDGPADDERGADGDSALMIGFGAGFGESYGTASVAYLGSLLSFSLGSEDLRGVKAVTGR